MKGFIKVYKNEEPLLLALNAILMVNSKDEKTTRIELLATDKAGNQEKIFVQPAFDEVCKLIEAAAR